MYLLLVLFFSPISFIYASKSDFFFFNFFYDVFLKLLCIVILSNYGLIYIKHYMKVYQILAFSLDDDTLNEF